MSVKTVAALCVGLLVAGCVKSPQEPAPEETTPSPIGDQLFIFQGAYDSLGTVDEIAALAARHDYVVVTHGFFLSGGIWMNGHCLDVNYSRMPGLLAGIRRRNPTVRIFAYVPATADHPN